MTRSGDQELTLSHDATCTSTAQAVRVGGWGPAAPIFGAPWGCSPHRTFLASRAQVHHSIGTVRSVHPSGLLVPPARSSPRECRSWIHAQGGLFARE